MRDLVELLGVVERTVYRDLQTLNDSGIPCVHDDRLGGYCVRRGFFMPPIDLTVEEAMAMATLLDQLPASEELPFLEQASRAIEKIRSQLPRAVLDEIEPLDDHVSIQLARGMADDSPRDVYETVRQAIATRRLLECEYESIEAINDQASERFELRPYVLWYCQRAWYVVGQRSDRDGVRNLKLNRFARVRVTDQPYHIPEDFKMCDHLGLAWRMIRGDTRYKIAVQFEPGFSETASETRWHPTQVEEWDSAGKRVTLRFEVDGFDEIVWWVLGYGPAAKVLEPPELIEKVRELARATAERYARR